MIMTKAQMRATVPQRAAEFEKRIGQYLRDCYPNLAFDDDTLLLDRIARAHRYARELGFTSDQHVVDVVEACALLGGEVYQHVLFQRIVKNPTWHNEEKCQAIRTHIIAISPKAKL